MALTAYCQVPEKRGLALTQMLLVMKFTAILLFMACLQVSATGYAQRITIHEQNASVGRIFDEIRQQTAYTFVYTDDFLQAAKKVTVKVTNASIEEVPPMRIRRSPWNSRISGMSGKR